MPAFPARPEILMLLATGAGRDSGLITAFAARGPKKFIRPSPKHTKRGIKKLEDAQGKLDGVTFQAFC